MDVLEIGRIILLPDVDFKDFVVDETLWFRQDLFERIVRFVNGAYFCLVHSIDFQKRMFDNVFYLVLIMQPLRHIPEDLICKIDFVVFADDEALVLAIEDLPIKLCRSIDLDHFRETSSLVHIDVVERRLQVYVEENDDLADGKIKKYCEGTVHEGLYGYAVVDVPVSQLGTDPTHIGKRVLPFLKNEINHVYVPEDQSQEENDGTNLFFGPSFTGLILM